MTEELFKPIKFKRLDWKNVVLVLLTVLGIAMLGCNQFMDQLTPAPMDLLVTDYVGQDVPEVFGYTSLYFAKQLRLRGDILHRTKLIQFRREIKDNDLQHSDMAKYINASIEAGQAVQDIVVGGEGNPFSIAGLLATAAPGLLIGMRIKRKQDYSPEQVQKLAKKVQERTEEKMKGLVV